MCFRVVVDGSDRPLRAKTTHLYRSLCASSSPCVRILSALFEEAVSLLPRRIFTLKRKRLPVFDARRPTSTQTGLGSLRAWTWSQQSAHLVTEPRKRRLSAHKMCTRLETSACRRERALGGYRDCPCDLESRDRARGVECASSRLPAERVYFGNGLGPQALGICLDRNCPGAQHRK
ncbi:hypothetical protein FA95DRAFT_415801 [Auriscalpium vulgare]|uniref:Uncharacterized protein n=1 Tax=Auriscalpium vulgare TaxID=40419 RepID=A0ACB8S3C6_9AGAM|nr:hypothetical protein FA95DRAFT_415801 [Auriscalpium vulgare]